MNHEIVIPSGIIFYPIMCLISVDIFYKGFKMWKYQELNLYFPVNLIMNVVGLFIGKYGKQKRIDNLFPKERMNQIGISAMFSSLILFILCLSELVEDIQAIRINI